jgi:hypothetical protein
LNHITDEQLMHKHLMDHSAVKMPWERDREMGESETEAHLAGLFDSDPIRKEFHESAQEEAAMTMVALCLALGLALALAAAGWVIGSINDHHDRLDHLERRLGHVALTV